jgi:hypothetical protein
MPAPPALLPAPDAPDALPDVPIAPAVPVVPDVPPAPFAAPLEPRVPLVPALAILPPLALAPPFALAPAVPPAPLFAPDDEVPLEPHANGTSSIVNTHAVEAILTIAIDASWRGVALAITILSPPRAQSPLFRSKSVVLTDNARKILILCAR